MSKKLDLVLSCLLPILLLSFTLTGVGFGIGISVYLKEKSVATDSVTWWVPDDFVTIQEAISSPLVSPGDTIRVKPGVYNEHVIVDKAVSLIGEDHMTAIIDGGGIGTVVNVTASNVYFSGFTVRNGDYGIFVFGSTNSIVSGNNVNSNEWEGIWLDHSNYSVVSENNASNNRYDGIWLTHSSHCTVDKNTVDNNYAYGIIADKFSNNCMISENNATQNWIGISVERESHNCAVTENNANNNQYHGIQTYLSQNCTITRNNADSNFYYGIYAYFSNDSVISRNTANNNGEGVYLMQSDRCTVDKNELHNNYYGLWLVYSDHCTAAGNTVSNNTTGIHLYSSNDTSVYHNNLLNNTNQVELIESYDCDWDNGYPSGGNYWSNYFAVDHFSGPGQNESGSDGIGDTPHVINVNNTDNYPLMNQWTNIAITDVLPYKTVVGQGYSISINVTIENQGDYAETFNVTAYYNDTIITLLDGKNYTPITLASRTFTTVTLVWETTSVVKGNYTLTVVAATVLGETDTSDNTFTDGWVVVAMPGDITGATGDPWDFIPDSKVDGKDLFPVSRGFGAYPGIPTGPIWHPNSDIDNDGKIDGRDIFVIKRRFGETGP